MHTKRFALDLVLALTNRDAGIAPEGTEQLVGALKPSQPQRIISGLKETFIEKYIVERTNRAEIRPEEQNEKAESCWENLWDKIQLKWP